MKGDLEYWFFSDDEPAFEWRATVPFEEFAAALIAYKSRPEPARSNKGMSDPLIELSPQWRKAYERQLFVMEYARITGQISEMVDTPSYASFAVGWGKLPEDDQRSFLDRRFPSKRIVEIARTLAGEEIEISPDHRKIADTPAARAAARRKMGL